MPFECAKALAQTFCYPIRELLTPIFGPHFVDTCLPIDDPEFGSFKIDTDIIRQCREDMNSWQSAQRFDTPQCLSSSPARSTCTEHTAASACSTPLHQQSIQANRNKDSPCISPKTIPVDSEWSNMNRITKSETPRISTPETPLVTIHTRSGLKDEQRDPEFDDLVRGTANLCSEHCSAPSPKTVEDRCSQEPSPPGSYGYHAQDHQAACILLELSKDARGFDESTVAGPSSLARLPISNPEPADLSPSSEREENKVPRKSVERCKKKRVAADAFAEPLEHGSRSKKPSRKR